jgi:predicted nucleic acid-binding protein
MRSPAASAVGLIDTGAILALIDRSDKWHASCVEAYDNSRLPLLTTEAVLPEVFCLSERNICDARNVWFLLRSGAIQMSPIAHEDLPRIQALMAQYADRPMDFADATLVHVAARERLSLILTVDPDDFETTGSQAAKSSQSSGAGREASSTATMMAEEPKRSAPSKP